MQLPEESVPVDDARSLPKTGDRRGLALSTLGGLVTGPTPGHTTRVAIDGITGSGKTTLANELAEVVARARPVIRMTMDGYHRPRAHRYRQGRQSADGYYEDAYDFAAFAAEVLRPLGPGGTGRYRAAIIDLTTDSLVDDPPVPAPDAAVLIVDGSFLQRAELDGLWDLTVFVDTRFDVALRRGVQRDQEMLGGPEDAERIFTSRYHAAARRYLAEHDPRRRADVVVVNDDLRNPLIEIRSPMS